MANNTKISETTKQDPGFLVAKGRFVSRLESDRQQKFRDRDDLLRSGQSGESLEVVELTRLINDLDKQIDFDRKMMEKDHVKSLAGAIFMTMSDCGYANIRAVGRNASYNAVKAIAIATLNCQSRGIDLCFSVVFDEGNLGHLRKDGHVQNVTAILYKLKGYKDWKGQDNANN